jgi:hypothetical protein
MKSAVTNRRSLGLSPESHQGVPHGTHAMRRGGPRREVSERVFLQRDDGRALDGWALNVSRGGLRAIVEEAVDLGQEFEVRVGMNDDSPLLRRGRVVWKQDEPDGVIVGIEFIGLSGTHVAVPPSVEPDEVASDEPAES